MNNNHNYEQLGIEYERKVQKFTGGISQIIQGREIDSVTSEALIQAKDSQSAIYTPHNFLNKKVRSQIKITIELAKKEKKRAEFWFKNKPHFDVIKYIENKGGIVKIWNQED
jgi:spore cortex formation protein SpoVR/YcgB (stage V sporulation)